MTKKQRQIEVLKAAFLHYLAETGGNVLRSCERSGLARNTALRHKAKDPAFAEKWYKIESGLKAAVNADYSTNTASEIAYEDLRKPQISGNSHNDANNNSEQFEQPSTGGYFTTIPPRSEQAQPYHEREELERFFRDNTELNKEKNWWE